MQPGVLDEWRRNLRLGLERADEVPDEQQARGVFGGPLGLVVDEVARVSEEELRQVLACFLEDEGVQPFSLNRPDAADGLDGQLALAPLALWVEQQLPGPSRRHREPPFARKRGGEGRGRQPRH